MPLFESFDGDVVTLDEDHTLIFIILISCSAFIILCPKRCCSFLCCCCAIRYDDLVMPFHGDDEKGESRAILDHQRTKRLAAIAAESRIRAMITFALESGLMDRLRLLLGWLLFWLAAKSLRFNEAAEFMGKKFDKVMDRVCSVPFAVSLMLLMLSGVDFCVMRLRVALVLVDDGLGNSNIGVAEIVRDLGRALVYLAFFLFLLGFLSENMDGLMNNLTLGTSAILAFGCAKVVENVWGLCFIIFDKPFALHDHIAVGGVEGFVAKVGLRSFIVNGFDGTSYFVPNSTVLNSEIRNFYTSDQTREHIEFTLSYVSGGAAVYGTLRQSLLAFFRETIPGWLDIKLDLKPEGVNFHVCYAYPKGEALAKSKDPGWNFFFDGRDFRAAAITHICDEVKRFELSFATFPVHMKTAQ